MAPRLNRRRLLPALFGALLVLGLGALRYADPYPIQALRDIAFDFYQRLAPRADADYPVHIVDIDDASLSRYGQWPWPRDRLAEMTRRLAELGAAAIVFDIVFPEPDRLSPANIGAALAEAAALPDYDAQFAQALAAAPSVLGFAMAVDAKTMPGPPKAGMAISGDDPIGAVPRLTGAVLPIPQLAGAAAGLGAFSLDRSTSVSVVRRMPLLWSDGQSLFPALSVEALRVAFGISTLVVLGDTTGSGAVEALRIADLTVPTTARGELYLYFRPLPAERILSAQALLDDGYRDLAPRVAGQIVLIGTSAAGLADMRGTPLGQDVPGVTIHAQAIEQMLGQAFLTRSDAVMGFELLAFLAIGFALVLVVSRTGPLLGLGSALAVALAAIALSWMLFRQAGWLVDPSFPLLGAVVIYAAMTFLRFLTTDRDKRRIRDAFGHYVSPALLKSIEERADSLKLGGEMRELTVMFSDLRNFSTISETMHPQAVLAMLNTLFGALGHEITEQFGTIDKFIGDAIMAFWNAPVDVDRHALRACRAALAMRQTLRELNRDRAFPEDRRLEIGIGIATGEVLVGNMGLDTRFDYSCVGDSVNTASRIEGACKTLGYDVLIAAPTRAAAPGLASLYAGAVALKGLSEREPIFLLVGDEALAASDDFAALHQRHTALLHALAAGADLAPLLAACLQAAEKLDPRLGTFYARLESRREDFAARADAG